MTDNDSSQNIDADLVIVGGGPAGLQAALTAGRVHRRVVLLDAGEGRNAPASHMHNVLTRDGTPPARFREIAAAELTAYPTVEQRAARVSAVVDESAQEGPTRFRVELEDGGGVTGRTLLLATGARDDLPPIDGLAPLWGDVAAACPFCHGHEFAGKRVAVMAGEASAHLVPLLAPITDDLVVIDPTDVVSVERHGEGARLHTRRGGVEDVAGIFLRPEARQGAPFAEQLGLRLNDSGFTWIDERGRTSRRGVYAAGDAAHIEALPMPMPSVVGALAAGLMAAATVVADLLATDQAAPGRRDPAATRRRDPVATGRRDPMATT